MTNTPRTWLIAALTHRQLPAITEPQFVELVEVADSEGVLVLLEHRLSNHPAYLDIPPDLLSQIQQAAKQGLMDQLPFFAELSSFESGENSVSGDERCGAWQLAV